MKAVNYTASEGVLHNVDHMNGAFFPPKIQMVCGHSMRNFKYLFYK